MITLIASCDKCHNYVDKEAIRLFVFRELSLEPNQEDVYRKLQKEHEFHLCPSCSQELLPEWIREGRLQ